MKEEKEYIDSLSKAIWENTEIEWTSGSNKSYGEAVFQQWETLLKENPSKRNIRKLKDQVKGLGIRIEMLTEEHEADIKDPYTGVEPRLSTLELIELYEEALHHLKKLLERYDKPPLTLEEKVEKWVDEFKPNTRHREDYINYGVYLSKRSDIQEKSNGKLIKDLGKEFGALAVEVRMMHIFLTGFKNDFYNNLKN